MGATKTRKTCSVWAKPGGAEAPILRVLVLGVKRNRRTPRRTTAALRARDRERAQVFGRGVSQFTLGQRID